jgi:hypothetical protein
MCESRCECVCINLCWWIFVKGLSARSIIIIRAVSACALTAVAAARKIIIAQKLSGARGPILGNAV